MQYMHHGMDTVQFNTKPRTGRLPKLCTESVQETFDVTPTDLRWCGRTENQFEGLPLLRVHTDKISINDTSINTLFSCMLCSLQRRMLLEIEIGVNQDGAEMVSGKIERFDTATGDGGE